MKTTIRQQTKSQAAAQAGFVKQQFRKGYTVPVLAYQKYGIISKMLWPSKDQIIRIVPGYDPATGKVFRQNINVTEYSSDASLDDYLSDTFITATTVSKFGSVTTPFITDYEPGSVDEQTYGGDTVLRNFIRGIQYACAQGKGRKRLKPINEWLAWTNIGPQNMLSYDKPSLLMQALVFKVNGRNNQDFEADDERDLVDDDGDILPLLAVVAIDNKTSIANVMQALTEPTDPSKPLDAATNSKFGALAELEGNKLFLNTYTDTAGHAALRPSVQAPGKGWTPTPFNLDEEVVRQLWHPWEELLNYMSSQEQLELCAQEFGADTVNYVIGTDPKFANLPMPEHIRNAGFGRYASLVGGSVQISNTQQAAKPAASLGKGLSSAKGLAGAAAKAPIVGAALPSDVDVEALRAETARIRAGAAGTSQADAAADLLGDPDINEDDVQ